MSIINKVIEENINNKIIRELNNLFQKIDGLEGSNICKNIIKKPVDLSLYEEYNLCVEYMKEPIFKKLGKVVELPVNNEDRDLYYIDIADFKEELCYNYIKEILFFDELGEGKVGFIIDLNLIKTSLILDKIIIRGWGD